MKTEEFFEMLGELDENLIAKASEDLENYRYSLGQSYHMDEKDKFSWKRMSIAAVCAAAVMFGAFFVVKSFYDEDIPYYPGGQSDTSDDVSSGGNSSEDSNASSDTSSKSSEDSSTSSDTSSTSSEPVVSEDKPAYDAVFKGVNLPGVSGPPLTYEEIVDRLKPDPESPQYDIDSLYLVEVIRALSPEETKKLTGFDEQYFFSTIYSVRILTDLNSGETVNKTANVVASSGTVEYQEPGDPPYAPGERFTAALTKPYAGKDYLWSSAGFLFGYDVVEENGKTMLYSRGNDTDEQNLPTSKNINEKVVTSTTKNPAEYTQKLELSALVDFWRKLMKDLADNSVSVFEPKTPYFYQEAIESGRISPDAPKLDLATAKKIIAEIGFYYEIIAEFEKVQPYADYSKYTGTQYTKYCPTQYEVISTVLDQGEIDYIQYNPDGTIKHSEVLFKMDYGYGFDPNEHFLFYTSYSKRHQLKRGDEFTVTIDMVNNMGKPYVFEGSESQYRPEIKLYYSENGEEYVLPCEFIPDTDDSGRHEIAPGELRTFTYHFKIPEDAPIGAYCDLISYENSEKSYPTAIFVED